MSLEGKVVVITGAGSGIGRGIAELLASNGCSIAIAELDEKNGTSAAEGIQQVRGTAEFIHTDVADEESVKRMVEHVIEKFGAIYGLVNNAGIGGKRTEATAMSTAEWDLVMDINLRGAFLCARAAIPHMRARGGAIVNIASVHANFAFAGCAHYDASKGGMVSLTRTLALENGPYQIRVNAICPGYIDTPHWVEWLATQADPVRIERENKGVASAAPSGIAARHSEGGTLPALR